MALNHWSRTLGAVVSACALLAPVGCAGMSQPKEDPDLNARRASSHFNIAVDHQQNGRVELALRELLTAQHLDPEHPQILHALGITYLRKGKQVEAERFMKRAVAIAPDYQDARYNLSTLYLNQGRYADCIEQSQILYDDPTFTQPWRALTNWGWAAYKLGRVDEARRHLGYASDYNPRYWPTLFNLGILASEQGNQTEAVRYFEKALDLDPGPSAVAEANYRLAEIYVSMGNRRQAIASLRTAVVKAPRDPWGKKSEEYLKLLR